MESLHTQTINTYFSNNNPQNGGDKWIIPVPCVTIAKPLSYEFRVAEFVNEKNEIMKVGLQVAIFEHDNYGVRQLVKNWTDIERVKVPV